MFVRKNLPFAISSSWLQMYCLAGPSPLGDSPASIVDQTNSAGSKGAAIISLMERDAGTSMADLIAATGWLPHTTRAALNRLRKKGLTIERGRAEQGDVTVYGIIQDLPALAA